MFCFVFANLYLWRPSSRCGGGDKKPRVLCRKAGLPAGDGAQLADSPRSQPSVGTALSKESSFAKEMPPSQGNPGQPRQLWRLTPAPEPRVGLPKASWRLQHSLISLCAQSCPFPFLPVVGAPKNTPKQTFCMLVSLTPWWTAQAISLRIWIPWAK